MSDLAGDAPDGGPIQILNISMGQDTGGQQLRMARAFRKHSPTDRYISIARQRTFYEQAEKWDLSKLKQDWWPNADVLHLHNDSRIADRLKHYVGGHSLRKPRLVHFHGTAFRTRPDHFLEQVQREGVLAIASTLDLVAIAPEILIWLPAPYDPDYLQSFRAAQTDPDVLKIAHAPTNRAVKSTEVLVAAVNKMKGLGLRVDLDIIEKQPHAECLRRKGQADVYVDQLLLGYGCNAVEAFGMGIPVIAGIDPEKAPERIRQQVPGSTPGLMEETWNGFPFLSATEDTLLKALLQMRNPDTRLQWARKGIEHFSRFHTDAVVVPMLRALYQKAINEQA